MENLKISSTKTVTLVDLVEDRLIQYFSDHQLGPGSTIPSEIKLAEELGVARSVLREALSRLKMMGMIESRTRRGIAISEPSLFNGIEKIINPLWLTEDTLLDILELRMVIEIGLTDSIFRNITGEDIAELEEIVSVGTAVGNNKYAPISEYQFHTKLYEITGNKAVKEFQTMIHPIMEFVKDRYKDYFEKIAAKIEADGETVSHKMLLEYLKAGDREGYRHGILRHFKIYSDYLASRKLKRSH